MDRNQSWPTGWPSAIDERQFKVDIPVAECSFQAMKPDTKPDDVANVPFTRSVDRLLKTGLHAKNPLNMFHYLIIAYILLGRVTDLIHSIHDNPSSPEYMEQCQELDNYVLKLRLSMPRAASSVLDAAPEDRGQVVWLDAILATILILVHYRSVPTASPEGVKDLFSKTITAAKTLSQTVKNASRTSIDLLLNVHIASSLYVGKDMRLAT